MSNLVNKHDQFVRFFLNNKNAAYGFLTIHLSSEIKAQYDLTTLEIQSNSYIAKNLKASSSDILYKLKPFEPDHKRLAYIYVLIEH